MLLALILTFFYRCNYNANEDRLKIYIKSLTGWMVYVFLLTEGLSLFHGITRINLIIAWLAYDLVLFFLIIRRGQIRFFFRNTGFSKELFAKNCVLLVLGAASLALAVNTVPYNWDSMTYHLSRIVYWSQNKSVEHYATSIVRQVASPVLAEFVNLHVYVLMNGNDRFVNVLQSASFVTNAVLIYGITKKLCPGQKGAGGLAAFLFMTMPIAFGESLTTQVDEFAALWVLSLVYVLLEYIKPDEKFVWDRKTVNDTFYMSVMIAFGYLTKPSVMVAILFLAVWLLLSSIRRKDDRFTVLKLLAVSVMTLGIFMAPEIIRNIYTFHAISAPIAGAKQLVASKNPLYIFINFIKNFVWNFPSIYMKGSTMVPEAVVYKLAKILGVNINDPGIAENGHAFSMIVPRSFHHDNAVNPIVFYAAILCWLWFICMGISKRRGEFRLEIGECYSMAVSISFILFCAILRWEPFVTRYMLTYLALVCPMVVWQFYNWMERLARKKYAYILLGVFLGVSFSECTYMLNYHWQFSDFSSVREGGSREEKYLYYEKEDVYSNYLEVQNFISEQGYREVGIITGEDDKEYPLLVMLDSNVDQIMHVNVNNDTGKYEDIDFCPDCIIIMGGGGDISSIECHGRLYDEISVKNKTMTVLSERHKKE